VPSSVTVIKEPDGRYYASFVVEREATPLPACDREVGIDHDRDVNAAKNVLALGRRESLNACGRAVRPERRPAVAAEAGTHRSAA
jgi:transposase